MEEEALSKDSSRSHRHLLQQHSHSSSSQAQLRPASAAVAVLKEVKQEERMEVEQEMLVTMAGGKASSQSEEDLKQQQRRGAEEEEGGETIAMAMATTATTTTTTVTLATTTVVGPSKNGGQSEWTSLAVSSLLDLYSEKFASGKGCLRVKDWEEVVHYVNDHIEGPRNYKTLKQCRDKVDSLKRRYKIEKKKENDFGVGSVSWPYFAQLDRMLRAPPKPVRAVGIDAGGVNLDYPPPSRSAERQLPPSRYENDHHPSTTTATNTTTATGFASSLHHHKGKSIQPSDDSDDNNSYEEEEEPEPPLIPPNRNRIEPNNYDISDSSDDSDGYSTPSCSERNLSSKDCTSGLVDKDSGRRRHCLGLAGKRPISKKQRAKRNHPIQALADAVIGFADVFARIEMAKVEIVTKMKIELAKLKQRRKKRRDSSSLSSESD